MPEVQRGFPEHQRWAIWMSAAATLLVVLLDLDMSFAGAAQRPSTVTPQQGIAATSRAISTNPKHTKSYLRRAGYHLALARHEAGERHLRAAADDFAKAAQLAPKSPMIHRQYAEIAAKLQEYQLAVSEYSAALKLAPKHAATYLGRGLAYLALRKDRHAKADFARAISLNPALRKHMEVEQQRIRHVRLAQDAGARLTQAQPIQDSVKGFSPDLICRGAVPIHVVAKCSSMERQAVPP